MSVQQLDRIDRSRRFTNRNPCPICDGYDGEARGKGRRCYGFLSGGGEWAHCTREEFAGNLPKNPSSGTYAHKLRGSCKCGREHSAAPVARPTRPSAPRQDAEPKRRRGPVPQYLDGAKLADEFPYHRPNGSVAYRVLRYDFPLQPGEPKPDKTFKQVRQLDTMTWAWGLGDTERVLYRLPALRAAPPARPVFIVEGERCADALAAIGLVATTCSEGAKKWTQVPGRHDALRGRHVTILPDNDDAGRGHARQIADDLAGVAASVRVVALPGLPAKGDVVEWLAAGGDAVALLELVIATPVEQQASGTSPCQENCPETQVVAPGAKDPTVAALALAEEANARLRARAAWDKRLRANNQLRPIYKPTLSLVVEEWAKIRPRDANGHMSVYRQAWAKRLGIDEKAVSRHLEKLEKCGAITRHYETTYEPGTGLPRKHLAIAPTDALLTRPESLTMTGWGGKRAHYCQNPECGSDDLVERRVIVCRSCGTVQSSTVRALNVPPDATESDGWGGEEQAGDTVASQENCPETQVVPPGDGTPVEWTTTGHARAARGFPSRDGELPIFVPTAPDARPRHAYFDRSGPRRDEPCPCGAPPQWGLVAGEETCMKCGTPWKAEAMV